MKYKAVIFDLDGTLLDTLQDIANSVNEALSHLGFPTHEVETYKSFIGGGRDVLAFRALPDHHRDSNIVAQLIERINEEYSKRWADNTVPYRGIPDLLDVLTMRNIKMAVLSNKGHDSTEMMVSEMLSRWYFEAIAGVLPSVPKKPDPSAALRIAQRLRIPTTEFLYVGDSDIDMKTATGAGMYPVGVLWGFSSSKELLAGGAKALIEHPNDLLPFL